MERETEPTEFDRPRRWRQSIPGATTGGSRDLETYNMCRVPIGPDNGAQLAETGTSLSPISTSSDKVVVRVEPGEVDIAMNGDFKLEAGGSYDLHVVDMKGDYRVDVALADQNDILHDTRAALLTSRKERPLLAAPPPPGTTEAVYLVIALGKRKVEFPIFLLAPEMSSPPTQPPTWDDQTSPAALESALEIRAAARAEMLIELLLNDLRSTGRRLPDDVTKKVLDALRSYTEFEALEMVCGALLDTGQSEPPIRRQLAQAYIEAGRMTDAIAVLKQLDEEYGRDAKGGDPAWSETVGLLGRAYKQLYLDAAPNRTEPRDEDVTRACDHYEEAYRSDPERHHWHGINLVGLTAHRERVRVGDPLVVPAPARKMAQELLDVLSKIPDDAHEPWHHATRAEAFIARGDTRAAIRETKEYLDSNRLDAFMIRGTLRQFEQLWGLTEERPPGDTLLPMMKARFAELGGAVNLDPGDESKRLERVFGDTRYQPVRWLQTGLARARSVARIGLGPDRGVGTGFLFPGGEISPAHAGRTLLLTNAHVCSDAPHVVTRHHAIPPASVAVHFLEEGRRVCAESGVRVLWTSPPWNLDATLLEIVAPSESVREITPTPLSAAAIALKDRLYMIGHPFGGDMTFSLQDNRVVQMQDPYVHYRTPSDPGTSGSPLFDADWNVVALHRGTRRDLRANEGICIRRIVKAMRKALA